MSDPSDRYGLFLPGMSWFSEVEAEGRLISREWKAWRQASKVQNRQTSSPLAVPRQIRFSLLPLQLCRTRPRRKNAEISGTAGQIEFGGAVRVKAPVVIDVVSKAPY